MEGRKQPEKERERWGEWGAMRGPESENNRIWQAIVFAATKGPATY